ncbi:MAG: efflux RND transporter permease subunit [Eubacterium sp.]|nr:efflux RND transporter permease subunit [Eubacterium sp.]
MSKFSVRRPYTVLVGVVLVLVLGYLSFSNMSMDFLPSMEMPYAIVMTQYPGASPEEVELAVTSPVESAMARISNVKSIQSISNPDMSVVIMEFEDGTDMNGTTIDMRESLDTIRSYWDDSIGNPTIMKINPDMMPIMVAAVNYKGKDAVEVSKKANDDIIPEIESVGGVASVQSVGQIEEKIDVTLRQDKIDEMNKKVLDALEKKFEKAEKKIDKGEDKIKKGKDTLDSKKQQAAGQMAQGGTKLNQASSKIDDGLKQIDEQIKNVKEQQKKLLKSEKQAKTGAAAMATQKKTLQATIKNLKNAKSLLTQAKDTLAKLDTQITGLEAQIDAMGGEGTEQLESQVAGLKAMREKIIKEMEKNDVKEDELEDKLKEVTDGLSQAEAGLKEIKKQEKKLKKGNAQIKKAKKQIKSGLAKMYAMRSKLSSGKITTEKAMEQLNKQQILAGIEMSVAQAGLNSGAEELKKAKTEFKNTKKTAKENMDLDKLLTKEMLENILKAENFEMPAGYVEEKDATYLVKVGDKLTSEADIRDLVLLDFDMKDLDPIRLSDVADVVTTNNAEDVYTVVNGEPAVAVILQKQSGYSTGDVTNAVLERFETLKKEYDDLEVTVMMDQGIYIDLVVGAVGQNLLFGGLLAIVILLLFLWDLRPTLIVACSIPLSLVGAIVAMYFSGVTLNIISLSGLALGVGMLVDNSVVVIENIYRMRQAGLNIRSAAILGAKQVVGAIIASTLTTVCVFAPIIFTEGITKQLFSDLGLTLAYTLLASLIIAMTLVPAMSSGMLRRAREKEPRLIRALQNGYVKLLRPMLRAKWLVIIGSFGLLALFIWLAIQNGTTMMPDMESPQITLTLKTDEEKTFDDTKKISNEVIDRVKDIPDMDSIGAFTGGSNFMAMMSGRSGAGAGNTVSMYALLKEERTMSNDELRDAIEERTKDIDCDLKINMQAMDMSSLTGEGVRIDIKGRDLDKLRTISEELMEKLKAVEGVTDLKNGLENSGDEFRISIDKAKAMRYSLTVAQVFAEVRKKVAEATSASKVSTDTNDYNVFVKSSSDEDLTRDLLQDLKLDYTDAQTQKKKTVKLSKIASFETVPSPVAINHMGQSRCVSVKGSIEEGVLVDTVGAEVKKIVEAYEAPVGYTIEMNGENEATQEAIGQVMLMMVLAVVLMYLIMVAQFQGLLSPFIILFTIPLAFTGGFIGLWISGSEVSVISLIGFVMLSGIIVNNGIVLVDFTNKLRTIGEGMEKREAIVEAGRTRLRPILMTAITTVLGLIPMVFGKQMGSDMSRPMAIVVIGGLVYGTLLTLFVVPCMYDLFARKHMRSQAETERLEQQISDAELKRIEMGGYIEQADTGVDAGAGTETGGAFGETADADADGASGETAGADAGEAAEGETANEEK